MILEKPFFAKTSKFNHEEPPSKSSPDSDAAEFTGKIARMFFERVADEPTGSEACIVQVAPNLMPKDPFGE